MMTIKEAVAFLIAKANSGRRARRKFIRLERIQERKMLAAVKEWMEEMIRTLQAGLPKMKGRSPAARAKSIADWKALEERGIEIMKPPIFEALAVGGDSVMTKRPIRKQKQRFDIIGIEAVKWATEHSAELVVEVTEKTMTAIREYVKRGVDAGKSVPQIARELRPLVGLHEKQIMAVANYHEMLILERPEYTAATQRSMAETYARRLHRDRTATIARTETASSLNEGVREGYAQMGIKRLQRVEDPAACDECKDHDGQIYTIEEAEGVLPAHPSCEGAWVMA